MPALPLVAKLLRGLFLVLMNGEVAVPLLPEAQNCFQNPVAVGQALTRYLQAKFPQCCSWRAPRRRATRTSACCVATSSSG